MKCILSNKEIQEMVKKNLAETFNIEIARISVKLYTDPMNMPAADVWIKEPVQQFDEAV